MKLTQRPKFIFSISLLLNGIYYSTILYVWQKYFIFASNKVLIPWRIVFIISGLFSLIFVFMIIQLVDVVFKKIKNESFPSEFLGSFFLNLLAVILGFLVVIIILIL